MKQLTCRCGQVVYFENMYCGNCGRALAFDPGTLSMQSETEPGAGLRYCTNREGAVRCNWLADPASEAGACISCRSSRVIPSLSKLENLERWRRLEKAKRRLIYDLLTLDLPVEASRLSFVFKEDRRTNPDVHEEHVAIGHSQGVITINAAEADDVYRESMRLQVNEPYRTLLGHFRHEAGHFYFDQLVDETNRAGARELFGDEMQAYDTALQHYYANGPVPGWQEHFISAYASSHPAEDWAETFAHFLHIRAVLETAEAYEWRRSAQAPEWRSGFLEVVIPLNEMMRSLGLDDAYPFLITPAVAAKLDFIDAAVSRFTGRRDEPASQAR